MTSQPVPSANSERGIALIVVLLLMAVMSGLVTGIAMNGQVETAMASNETWYAGARAAAEAGINRATEAVTHNNAVNFLAGVDGIVDSANAAAAANDDNGDVGFLLTGAPPYALGTTGQYSYTIEILDDDDPSLYPSALTGDQLAAMAEDGDPFVNTNDRLILRATGLGPNGTVVRISRILDNVDTTELSTTTTTTSDPAILVNGDLTISGSPGVDGSKGNVHANGDLTINGNPSIAGDATATGDFDANDGWHAGGTQGGGMATINPPDIDANNYIQYATHILNSDGTMTTVATGVVSACPCNNWNFSGGNWTLSGNTATAGTYFVNGTATISGNPGSAKSPVALSLIATGSISVTGNPSLRPQNSAMLQFVTNGDLKLAGNVDLDYTTAVEGQSLVREQVTISGNPDIRGQIIVQNVESVSDVATNNEISGNPSITYNGSFGDIVTTIETPGSVTYTNNVSGWLES